MLKKNFLFLLFVVFLFAACSNNQTGIKGTDPLSGSGKFFNLKFKEQPSTGFSWEYSIDPKNDGTNIFFIERVEMDDENIQGQAPGLVGAPNDVTYTFSADGSGEDVLIFTYRRPWDGGEEAYRVEYDLVVDDNNDILCKNRNIVNIDYEAEVDEIPYPFFYNEG